MLGSVVLVPILIHPTIASNPNPTTITLLVIMMGMCGQSKIIQCNVISRYWNTVCRIEAITLIDQLSQESVHGDIKERRLEVEEREGRKRMVTAAE